MLGVVRHDHTGWEFRLLAHSEMEFGFRELGAGCVDLRPCFRSGEREFPRCDTDRGAVFLVGLLDFLEEGSGGVVVGCEELGGSPVDWAWVFREGMEGGDVVEEFEEDDR